MNNNNDKKKALTINTGITSSSAGVNAAAVGASPPPSTTPQAAAVPRANATTPQATAAAGGGTVDTSMLQSPIKATDSSDSQTFHSAGSNPWNISPAVTPTQSGDGSNSHLGFTASQGEDSFAQFAQLASTTPATTTTAAAAETSSGGLPKIAETTTPTTAANDNDNNNNSLSEPTNADAGQQPGDQQQTQQQQQQQPLIDFPGATPAVDTSNGSPQQQQPALASATGEEPYSPTAAGNMPTTPRTITSQLTVDTAIQEAGDYQMMQDHHKSPQGGLATTTTTAGLDPPASSQEGQQQQPEQGGRLWEAALKEAEKEKSSTGSKGERSRFAESIMERTRSRADPDALVSSSCATTANTPQTPYYLGGTLLFYIGSNYYIVVCSKSSACDAFFGVNLLTRFFFVDILTRNKTTAAKPSMITIGGDSEASYILSTALAKKRVRVVQLLLIGLVGLLLGLLGNFFVSASCNFATVQIQVGQSKTPFEFHFGLWKYSPIDSVFQGYSYCFKYDQNYAMDSPIVARIANIIALAAGLLSMSILWIYLIFGYTDKRRWKWAVRFGIFAGLVQLTTLYFFFGQLCQEYTCTFGPGAYLSVFTSVVWFAMACEMHYHMPVAQHATGYSENPNVGAAMDEPRALVTTMEMTHIDEVTREYITRVTGKTKEDEMPQLNRDLKGVRPRSGMFTPKSTNGSELYFPTPKGTYQAPDDTSFV